MPVSVSKMMRLLTRGVLLALVACPAWAATPTPDLTPPFIRAAGWGETFIREDLGGRMECWAWVDDLGAGDTVAVRAYLPNQYATPVFSLSQLGGDPLWTWSANLAPPVPAGLYEIHLIAEDASGNRSFIWPNLGVDDTLAPAPVAPPREYDFVSDMDRFVRGESEWLDLTTGAVERSAATDARPYVFVAGYGSSEISQAQGGEFEMIAIVTDGSGAGIDSLDVLSGLGTVDTGVDLTPDAGLYRLGPIALGPGQLPASDGIDLGLELAAVDTAGERSTLWPYLEVFPAPTPTPTPTPTATPTPIPQPVPCLQALSPIIVGDPACLDASCSSWALAGDLEYRLEFPDGSGGTVYIPDQNAWRDDPVFKPLFLLSSNNYPITLCVRTKNNPDGVPPQIACATFEFVVNA